ncbi:MAG: DUF4123 domain-containing protein, partial [Tannerella sp.]|nr:DUF4123 domain-containing protein [Tannerella sp.]
WVLPEIQAEVDRIRKLRQAMQEQEAAERRMERYEGSPPPVNFLLLDAVVWDRYMADILEKSAQCRSLYATRGADSDLDGVAPYLLPYEPDTAFAGWLEENKRKNLRRMYLKSGLSGESLRRHLRHFLRVKTEGGKYLYFRFYDPYVFNTVFPNLTQKQAVEFFEPLEYAVTEDIRINERRIYFLSPEKELHIQYQTIDHVDHH